MISHATCGHPLHAFKRGFMSGLAKKLGHHQIKADGQLSIGFDFSSTRNRKRGNFNVDGSLNVRKNRPTHRNVVVIDTPVIENFNGNLDVDGIYREDTNVNDDTNIIGNIAVVGSIRDDRKRTNGNYNGILRPGMQVFDITNEGSGTGAIINIHQGNNDNGSTSTTAIAGTDFPNDTATAVESDIADDYGSDLGSTFDDNLGLSDNNDFDTNLNSDFGSTSSDYNSGFGSTDNATSDFDVGFNDYDSTATVATSNDYDSTATVDTNNDYSSDLGTDFGSTATDATSNDYSSDLGTDFGSGFDDTSSVTSNDYGSLDSTSDTFSNTGFDDPVDTFATDSNFAALSPVAETTNVRDSSADGFATFLNTNVDAMKDLSEYVRINWGAGPHRIRIRSRKRQPPQDYSTSSSLSLNNNRGTNSGGFAVVQAPLLYKTYASPARSTVFVPNTSGLVSNNLYLGSNFLEAGKSIVNAKDSRQKITNSNKRNRKSKNGRTQPISRTISSAKKINLVKPNGGTVTPSERSQLASLANFAELHRQSRLRSSKIGRSTGKSSSVINSRLIARNRKPQSFRQVTRRNGSRNPTAKAIAVSGKMNALFLDPSRTLKSLNAEERATLGRMVAAVLRKQASVQKGKQASVQKGQKALRKRSSVQKGQMKAVRRQ